MQPYVAAHVLIYLGYSPQNVIDLIRSKRSREVNGHFHSVSTKNGKLRYLPLPEFLVKDLKALAIATAPNEPLFTSPHKTPLRKSNFAKRVFKPAAERANLGKITFHELRHTAISQQLAVTKDVLSVSKIAGHANPSITLKVYGHELNASNDGIKEILEANYALAITRKISS
jgi:integrase